MTARPLRTPATAPAPPLTVINGGRSRGWRVAMWTMFLILIVGVFFSLILVRTALDESIFQLQTLNQSIEEQEAINQQLKLEITRLASPLVILPAAERLGLVLPDRVVSLAATGADGEQNPSITSRNDDPTRDLTRSATVP